MKDNKTYKELKEEYKREFDRVIIEMEEFRDNTELRSKIKEFEVPLPPKYLIDKGLKTKTYIVRSIGSGVKHACDGPMFFNKLSCLDLHKGYVRKKIKKIETLFRCLSCFMPVQLLNNIFNICVVNNDKVLNILSERRYNEQNEDL
jgi:hypothetical protein